ncbi:proline iminopeptidase-family hydrolase [Periweissella ghanensis]|uniref:Proline iminopeptidase n=1 Tax=Periweissella ghanensis TaxID=467997 RepID=A0ABN8BSY2_9LACO|nr:proline iminopeptidase-family hydrolase [Periweissella ghanensis]MCM0601885.1 proline iminopeptidase-family hydrolase [Periweissella ghanensis]CAH0418871.1 Proline iminopeptidase [Periweissella ghanensis]
MKTGTTIIDLDNGYHLWTNTQGTGTIHLLALHGGPGGNHEYWEDTAQRLQAQGLDIQVHMYDQLGSWYSDQPDFSDPKNANILTYDYYIDEVEEVRQKLGIDNFYLIGQSWGGALTQLYALKYGQHLKGAIISSMTDNIEEYVVSINQRREEALPTEAVAYMQAIEAAGNWDDAQYQSYVQILNEQYVDRKQPVLPTHLISTMATDVYGPFQGDNEFVVTGKLNEFDLRDQIQNITVPTLVTFGGHETMPVATAERMAKQIPHARLTITPDAGHHAMMDNPDVYYANLAQFIKDVEAGTFE